MKLKLTKNFWNNRYLNEDTGWNIGHISTPIKDYIDQLTNKSISILIPGCGYGYEAEYLFKNGFRNVFLIDLSPIALENFKMRVPEFPVNQLICDDFFNHKTHYDLIIEQTFFCAINPALRKKYAQHTASLLNKNGKLIGLLFNDTLNHDKPPFGGFKNEYLEIFNPYFNIINMDNAYNSIDARKNRELFIKMTKK